MTDRGTVPSCDCPSTGRSSSVFSSSALAARLTYPPVSSIEKRTLEALVLPELSSLGVPPSVGVVLDGDGQLEKAVHCFGEVLPRELFLGRGGSRLPCPGKSRVEGLSGGRSWLFLRWYAGGLAEYLSKWFGGLTSKSSASSLWKDGLTLEEALDAFETLEGVRLWPNFPRCEDLAGTWAKSLDEDIWEPGLS